MDNPMTQEEWKKIAEELKQKYPNLTDEDLVYGENEVKIEELLERLHEKIELTKEDIQYMLTRH